MKKIKVLMASPFVNLKVDTGNKIHQTNIVKHLSDDVWVNWIVQGDYKKKNVKITPVKRKGYGIFSGLSLLLDCFKKVNANAKKCDLVHDRGDLFCIGTFSKLLRKHNKPVVMQVDGDWVNAFVKARKSSVLIKPLMKAWVKKMFQTADVLVPVSKTLAKTIEEEYGISKDKIVVNCNGADVELFSKVKPKKFDEKSPRLLFMGALGAWYDIYTILKAMILLKEQGINVKCTFILSGLKYWPNLYEELKSFIKKNKLKVDVKREIPHKKVPSELNNADVLVAPYFKRAYGFSPLKLFEYMLMRKPIISNNFSEIKEILKHGEEGLLIPPEEPELMARAIKKLVSNPELRKKVSEKAYKKAAKNYSWKRHAREYERIYKKVVGF